MNVIRKLQERKQFVNDYTTGKWFYVHESAREAIVSSILTYTPIIFVFCLNHFFLSGNWAVYLWCGIVLLMLRPFDNREENHKSFKSKQELIDYLNRPNKEVNR